MGNRGQQTEGELAGGGEGVRTERGGIRRDRCCARRFLVAKRKPAARSPPGCNDAPAIETTKKTRNKCASETLTGGGGTRETKRCRECEIAPLNAGTPHRSPPAPPSNCGVFPPPATRTRRVSVRRVCFTWDERDIRGNRMVSASTLVCFFSSATRAGRSPQARSRIFSGCTQAQ